MPVSHLSLTVSHLPSSCSFFLTALQPLGYRYIGQHNNHIGFGIDEADFFICQDSLGVKPGAAHVAFNAPSRAAVDAFFNAALKAGGRIHNGAAVRDAATGYYSAAVIDLDGNAFEVVHRDIEDRMSTVSVTKRSEAPQPAGEVPRSVTNESTHRSPLRAMVNNIVTTTTSTVSPSKDSGNTTESSKALMGTLLGAAAGAAFAYAMVKSEKPDPPKETHVKRSETGHQTVEAPPTPRSVVSVESRRSRRHSSSYSDVSSTHSHPRRIRMIEAPPTPPSETSSPSTLRPKFIRAIEAPPPPPSIHKPVPAHTMPPPPSAETYYTVDVEAAPSHASRSSHRTHRSARPRRHSLSSNHRSYLPTDPSPSSISPFHKTPADFPLPPSAFSLPFSTSKSHSSRISGPPGPASIPLPPSTKSSHLTTVRSSRAPEAYPLPPSTKTSHVSHTRRSDRGPDLLPLRSTKTSLISLSHPPSPPRSVRSSGGRSTSTIKPLTRANLASGSRVGAGKASTDIDEESLAPSDSISQASGKERRRRRKRREEGEGGSVRRGISVGGGSRGWGGR